MPNARGRRPFQVRGYMAALYPSIASSIRNASPSLIGIIGRHIRGRSARVRCQSTHRRRGAPAAEPKFRGRYGYTAVQAAIVRASMPWRCMAAPIRAKSG